MCGKFLVFTDNLRIISGKLSNNNNVDFPKLPCKLEGRKTRTGSDEDVDVISTNRKRIRDDDSDDNVAVVEAAEPPAREPKPRRHPAKKKSTPL